MSPNRKTVVGLGEILWDLLPQGKQLGGAPANFAYHAAQLGERGVAASRVGEDPLGAEILGRIAALGLDPGFLQRDPSHPTGTVAVEIGPGGQPSYTIIENVAWDRLEFSPAWQALAAETDAVCFGSLAQRGDLARAAIQSFLQALRPEAVPIFDINLRGSFYSAELIGQGLGLAKIAKLNDEELPVVAGLLGLKSSGEIDLARELLDLRQLELVCVTRGARGSLLVSRGGVSEHPGYPAQVADTIGAGDAFVAAMAHHWLRGSELGRVNEAANRLGAFVASQPGATPPIPDEIRIAVQS